MNWKALLFIVTAGLLIWFAIRMIRSNPGMFNKESVEKSFYSMGILTALLIGFIALLVFLLKH